MILKGELSNGMNKQKLQEELKQSMLARDELKTSVLRMLLSAVNYYEIQKGAELSEDERARLLDKGGYYQASEEDILTVLQKEAKQRNDSIEQFRNAQRNDLAQKEERELQILKNYLPQQLSEEEIKALVEEAIKQTGASSISDIGKVMGYLSPKIKGKADGGTVSKLVKESLVK